MQRAGRERRINTRRILGDMRLTRLPADVYVYKRLARPLDATPCSLCLWNYKSIVKVTGPPSIVKTYYGFIGRTGLVQRFTTTADRRPCLSGSPECGWFAV